MTESSTPEQGTRHIQHRLLRQIGAALTAAAAAGGLLVWLRRRSHQGVAVPVAADPAVPLDGPDGLDPDVIHAAGHRHRVPNPVPPLRPMSEEHPPEAPERHRDRGGRSAAFHTERSG